VTRPEATNQAVNSHSAASRLTTTLTVISLLVVTVASAVAQEPNWPRFLGPAGNPVGGHPDLPDTWSRTENVEWSAEIPGMGWSSPIVWGNKVFLTAATSDQAMKQPSFGVDFSNDYVAELMEQGLEMDEVMRLIEVRDTELPDEIVVRLMLYCLDLESGEILWERRVHEGNPAVGRHRKNSFASETPVTDGEAIYVYFAHQGLYAYDFDGNQLWAAPLNPFEVYLDFGGGTSPALHEDRIYILNDNEEAGFVAAFDKRNGKEIWRRARSGLGKHRNSGWSSPFVWSNSLRTELVTMGPETAISYDLEGNELWRMKKMSFMPIPTPFAAADVLYLTAGPPGAGSWPIAAITPGADGDITLDDDATSSEHVVWYDWRAGTYLSTPVLYEGHLYVLQDKGIIAKYDADTGERVYRSRIGPGASAFTASPWAYNGKIFCLSEAGNTYVLGTGEDFELLGVNEIEEFALATPAMVGDRLLLRTQQHLWSIRASAGADALAPSPDTGAGRS